MFIKNKDDEELVRLVQEDDKYFGELIDRYEKKLDRYILRISSLPKEDREDLIQDVFLSVYRNIYDFDNSLKFSS